MHGFTLPQAGGPVAAMPNAGRRRSDELVRMKFPMPNENMPPVPPPQRIHLPDITRGFLTAGSLAMNHRSAV